MNTSGITLLSLLGGFLLIGLFGQWFGSERKRYLLKLAQTHGIKRERFREERKKYERFLILNSCFGCGGFFITAATVMSRMEVWWAVVFTILFTLFIAWLTRKPW